MILNNEEKGFTFLETLIVLAITIILSAGIGIPALKQIELAKKTAAQTQIETFRLALHCYYLDCGSYPQTAQGLKALFEKPTIYPVPIKWQGPYVDRKINGDPWGNSYTYNCPGRDGLAWTIVSYGSDGKEGGVKYEADINSWE